jgi:hypothetical protein
MDEYVKDMTGAGMAVRVRQRRRIRSARHRRNENAMESL